MSDYFSIGNDELARRPPLKEGDLYPCTKCGGEHKVTASRPVVRPDVPIASLLRHEWCGGRLARKADGDDWTSLCRKCESSGVVPGDFPHCGPHQWQPQWMKCEGCGESMHEIATYATDHPMGRVHYRRGERCGPLVPDESKPGYWQCHGAEMRRPTELLFYKCGDDTYLAGLGGRSL